MLTHINIMIASTTNVIYIVKPFNLRLFAFSLYGAFEGHFFFLFQDHFRPLKDHFHRLESRYHRLEWNYPPPSPRQAP